MARDASTAAQVSVARTLFQLPDYRRLWAIGGLTGIARWLEFLALSVFAYEVAGSSLRE